MDKRLFLNLLGLTVMVLTFTMCGNHPTSVPSTPEEALAELIAGNERYVNEECVNPRSDMERVKSTGSMMQSIITPTCRWNALSLTLM